MDRLTPERRSWLMSRVTSRNTSAEMRVRRVAHALGLRYRLHRHDLPGTPDLVFPKRGAVVFVHGCFWHRHAGCKKATTPKSRVEFWREKFARNVARDKRTAKELKSLGWTVAVIWECETRDPVALAHHLEAIFDIGRSSRRATRRGRRRRQKKASLREKV